MAEFLEVVKLGTFYHNGEALPLPIRPWQSGTYPNALSKRGEGDIPTFSGEIKDWTIGDTSSDDNKKLKWVKIKDGNKTLLICDRNILNGISWDELNKAEYVDGVKITIDGNNYLCRLISGGSNYRSETNNYSGGIPIDNEWDRFICNEDSIRGISKPNSNDLDCIDNTYKSLDGEHNKLWNWWGNYNWCKEICKKNYEYRVVRGCKSARYFNDAYDASYVDNSVGWRPVLEVLNLDNEDPEGNDSKDSNTEDNNSKDTTTKKFLIKQNDNYYTIDNGYIDLGKINTKSDLNNLLDKYGFQDLSLITKEFDGKKVHMSKDEDDIWETDSELDMKNVEDNIQLVEEDNEKYIKYGFIKCNIPDEIKKFNDGKFEVFMKE
ncbi:hypothetical protein [Clostridium botulinum]|uniref:hypothetical protein n=1 Tax=Clostridium botulinum TaxID=1491 RepID=UPI000D12A781|nr:hypothetical protein [Clostridium botulinum]AVQ45670.1 hypothetical protein C7M60_07620 [Clostridium botulinum]AVQ49609.1 hypothetical protein C7M58_09785 [Clostridium botulinum]